MLVVAGFAVALLAMFDGADRGRGAHDDPVPLEIAVPRRSTARHQLEHAAALKRQFLERKEAERDFWRELTVEAYQAVRVHHPDAMALGGEAAFRAGELLRAAGAGERALEEFRAAARLGRGTPFEARAELEIGHIHRRAGRTREALDAFHGVAASRTAAGRRRDDAWLWVGKLQHARGRTSDAVRAWRLVADGEGDALDRIEAFDLWALSLVESHDLEGAAGVLQAARTALFERSLEETEFGERVRAALERMRVVDRLTDAIEKRRTRDDSSSERALSRKS